MTIIVQHHFHSARLAITATLAVVCLAISAPAGVAAGAKKASVDNTYTIREKCVAKAQAAYPDNGLGSVTVMTQRTGIYADCARSHGIRP
jgi:hypothetical protein